ncbi:hypothetical protein [Sphingosinicella sp. BN140058]|uniref:hypothetical protein n=1 Tax=Sphingosinicella sp. BN140058 TaxID=1892855 RepID=UPI0010100A89|nr:hypothetical protein [Sphingosinicella sp. BN140058]QAY78777.1 hypothetical protein ETR14_21225 [Sphingosinicella sp. BN140058]
MRSNDDLRAEYLLIQSQYEAYDQRALTLKGLATPLLGAGLAIGVKESSSLILLGTLFVAASLWLLEAIWKSFQYCFAARIRTLEAWHRGEGDENIPAFQIFTEWGRSWGSDYSRWQALPPILMLPFVALPYAAVIAISLSAVALIELGGPGN